MKVLDKLKEIAKLTDEDYAEGMDDQDYDYDDGKYQDEGKDIYSSSEAEYTSRKHATSYSGYQTERTQPNLVDISTSSSAKPNVVFKQIERFDDVGSVADEINAKRIVILHLETCPNDVSRRVLDFLYGVAYANSGLIKRVAGRAYIINPSNVPLTGELLDEIENAGMGSY